jgi:(p)ppGpp synthase/HD superfamily hydrolase
LVLQAGVLRVFIPIGICPSEAESKIPEVMMIEMAHSSGNLAKVLAVVSAAGVVIESLEQVQRSGPKTMWELTVELEEDQPIAEIFQSIDD